MEDVTVPQADKVSTGDSSTEQVRIAAELAEILKRDWHETTCHIGQTGACDCLAHSFDAVVEDAIDAIADLRRERDELRRNDERYKWLRDESPLANVGTPTVYNDTDRGRILSGEELDAAVDAARTNA